jgi:hypothetical protein
MLRSSSEYPWKSRLLHDLVGVANHEQRPHWPAFPALHTDGDRQVDERLQNLGLHAFRAQETEAHVFLVGPHIDHQDGIRLAHGTSREQGHHHVTLGVQPTGDAADQGQLQLLGPPQVVLRQRDHGNAGGLDHRALGLAHHGLHQLLARPRLTAEDFLGQRDVAHVQQMVEGSLLGQRDRAFD